MQQKSKNKLKYLFLLTSLALLIGIIVIAIGRDSEAAKHQRVVPQDPSAAAHTYALLVGIPQRGSTLGYSKAPVMLQFFGDLQCEESRQVMLDALPFLIRRWVRAGKLQIRFRSTETDTKGAGGWPEFRSQQSAALAAGAQGKLWNFVDAFYRDQGPEFTGYADERFLDQVAEEAALDLESWKKARESSAGWESQLETDEKLAKRKRLNETPSFLIGPSGGPTRPLLHFGLDEPGVFEDAIMELL